MDFHLSEAQRMFRDSVKAFAERHPRAGALERAHRETHPRYVTTETRVASRFRECRGGMSAGASFEIPKHRIAESVFERSFSQRPPKG